MKVILPLVALTSTASAAIVTDSYSNPAAVDGQFGYESFITFSRIDSWSSVTSVGGWSYADLGAGKNPNRGWGHASSWFLIALTQDTTLNISMTAQVPDSATVNPGFTIYLGESIIHDTASLHTYSNNGLDLFALNDPWDDNGAIKAVPDGINTNDPGLGFAGNALSMSGTTASGSFELAAGRYTIAFGNAADSTQSPVGVTYDLNLSTIPEPTSTLLLALGSLGMLRRRR